MKRKDFSKLKITVQKEKDTYFEHEDFIAGVAPFLRGIHSTMYLQTPLETSVSDNLQQQENTSPEIELANFLTESFHYIQNSIQKSISVDVAISSLIFNTSITKNYVDNIAKIRAARLLWAKMIQQFKPKQQDALALKINAIVQNSSEATAAILGGCQKLSTKENNHLYFEEEIGILKTVDPWAGSLSIEKSTEEIANKAWILFEETQSKNGFL